MGKFSEVVRRYLHAQVNAGANAVQLFDSWVGSLSPTDYEDSSCPHVAHILKDLEKPALPVIHFGTTLERCSSGNRRRRHGDRRRLADTARPHRAAPATRGRCRATSTPSCSELPRASDPSRGRHPAPRRRPSRHIFNSATGSCRTLS